MNSQRFSLEIRFKDYGRPFNWRENLIRSITGSVEIKEAKVNIRDAIEIDLKNQNSKILIEQERLTIFSEHYLDIEQYKKFIDSVLERIVNNINWNKTSRIGIRAIWTYGVSDSYEDLVKKIKDNNFCKNTIVDESKDVALSLTFSDGKNEINYNSGVMSKKEIMQKYGISLENNAPDNCLVADVDYFSLNETTFNKKNLREFLDRALSYSKSKAEQTKDILI